MALARSFARVLFGGLVVLFVTAWSGEAAAQYRSFTFGFEGGYLVTTSGSELKPHNFAVGMFGGFKLEDRWWLTSKAMVSFPGQLDNAPNTVVMLHIVPVSARYYFKTDAFRPFVGVTNALNVLLNHTTNNDAFWGPGLTAGLEVRMKRDLFLGLQVDGYHMIVFEGPDAQMLTVNAQVLFFL